MGKWIKENNYLGQASSGQIGVWERQIEAAETAEAAQAQLLYITLQEIRTIKLILLWTLLLLPIAGAIMTAIVVMNIVPDVLPTYR